MRLASYGYDVLIVTLLISAGLMAGGYFIEGLPILHYGVMALGLFLLLFTLYFFRDPNRTLPDEDPDRIVIAPADGKVFLLHDIVESDYLKGPGKLIAIFLSPLDVHVNRNPINGVVELKDYHKGEFVPAFKDKSSEVNERTHIGVNGKHIRLLMKQIAGTIARRIVCPLEIGTQVQIGERYGMIKFGSRTDLLVPPGLEILVKPGDKVVGGQTIICRIPVGYNMERELSATSKSSITNPEDLWQSE